MEQIKKFIFSLQISPEIKDDLTAEKVLQKHSFYLQLARYLAPAFPAVPEAALRNLTGYSYLYFRFLLGLDSLLDGQADASTSARDARRLFAYLSIHEQAVRGLARLFPDEDCFWADFEQCKQEYAAANLREKKMSAQRTDFSEALFEEVAAGKSAVCYAMVHALSSLSRATEPVEELRRCLRHLHVAMQYLDDVEDFQQDGRDGQFTYAHFLVESHLSTAGIVAAELPGGALHRHLYTSGVAQQLLQRGYEHYSLSLASAQALGLRGLEQYLRLQLTKCRNYQQDVARLLQKTRIKAGKSFVLLHPEPLEVSAYGVQTAIRHSLQHLRLSRDPQGCWSDFMTSAGQSKLWATAYAGLQLAETKEGLTMAHEAFDASFCLPASYNESILQDGDSTNFAMGLRRKVWGESNPAQLATWLAFMDADGGWVTYRDADKLRKRLELPAQVSVADWLAPKLCVTAAAAYVLALYKELTPQFQASCDFLSRHQHPDGYWSSYWWTSPIYATTFAIMALAPLAVHDVRRHQALQWLAAQQSPEGAWHDAIGTAQPSSFFTALAIKALLSAGDEEYFPAAERAVHWLLRNQTTDGSWLTSRILRIPATDVADPDSVTRWRASSFGVNVLVDDHNRVFTVSTVVNALSAYARATVAAPAAVLTKVRL